MEESFMAWRKSIVPSDTTVLPGMQILPADKSQPGLSTISRIFHMSSERKRAFYCSYCCPAVLLLERLLTGHFPWWYLCKVPLGVSRRNTVTYLSWCRWPVKDL